MPVKQSTYRRDPTPNGLRAIEEDTLEWFSPELYANMNTGVLEEYIEERNKKNVFEYCPWSWKAVLFGMFIGTIFCVITEYVGLKVGIAIPGGGYIVYLVAILFRWKPTIINNAQGATAAATSIGSGFIFTFPALYLLYKHPDYRIGGTPAFPEFLIMDIPPMAVVMVSTILAGFLGTVYFIIFRRMWLIEDPLPVPGFEAGIQLLEIGYESWKGTAKGAMRTIKGITYASILSAGITFLRDMPIARDTINGTEIKVSLLDKWFGGQWYEAGNITVPPSWQKWTTMEFGIIPIQIGLGWYMRFRVAFLMSLGTLLTWFVIGPMSYAFEVPVFIVGFDFVSIRDFPNFYSGATPIFASYGNIGRVIAIGAILGGGMTALWKMRSAFLSAFKDVKKAMSGGAVGGETGDFVPGKGWYEWPLSHIPYMLVVAAIAIVVIFVIGGYPVGPTIAFAGVLVATTFFLGAISVKVMGETGTQPVSGTSFITLLMLVGLFKLMGITNELIAVMAILCTTIFGSSISMSGVIIGEYKAALYVGNRPFHLMKSTLTGIVSGAIFAVVGAIMFSDGMATIDPATGKPVLNLLAPQANAFAKLLQAVLGAASEPITHYLIFGFFLGVFAEYMTGMGTAFGLGMYFHLQLTLPMLMGGAARDIYEKRFLMPRVKREKWTERQTTLKVLDTFMMATGLIIGEAIMGVIVTIVLMVI